MFTPVHCFNMLLPPLPSVSPVAFVAPLAASSSWVQSLALLATVCFLEPDGLLEDVGEEGSFRGLLLVLLYKGIQGCGLCLHSLVCN